MYSNIILMSKKSRKNGNGRLTKIQSKQVEGMISKHHETKRIDIAISPTTVTAGAGVIVPITNISDGTKDGERIGLSINPTLIDIYYEFIADPADSTNICRLVLIEWKDNDVNNVPSLAKIFQDVSNERPLSYYNFAREHENFRVLHNAMHALSNDQGPMNVIRRVRLFGRRLPKEITYTGTAASDASGKIYLIAWSDSSVSGPVIKMHGMFAYKDA